MATIMKGSFIVKSRRAIPHMRNSKVSTRSGGLKCYSEITAKIDGHSGSQKALYSAHVYNVPRDRLSADF